MAKMRANDKALRALRFFIGLREPQIAAALSSRGFVHADWEEGWARLADLCLPRLAHAKRPRVVRRAPRATPALETSDVLAQLSAWERQWFPIASATTKHRFPLVHAGLFGKLGRASGPEVALSVQTFVERVEGLAASTPYGAEGPAAARS